MTADFSMDNAVNKARLGLGQVGIALQNGRREADELHIAALQQAPESPQCFRLGHLAGGL